MRNSVAIGDTRTVVHQTDHALGWVVLVSDNVAGARNWGVPSQLNGNGLSVLEVVVDPGQAKPSALRAVRAAVASLKGSTGSLPVLLGGVGRSATVAAVVAAETDAQGLLSIDGALLTVSWRLPEWDSPILLLSSADARLSSCAALRIGGAVHGRQAQVGRGRLGTTGANQSIREWRRAATHGAWADRPSSAHRLAVPVAAAMAFGGTATLLSGSPVAAAQRSGDSVASAAPASTGAATLGGSKVGHAQRRGDGKIGHIVRASLVDQAGYRYRVESEITTSSTSSATASAAVSSASHAQSLSASTANGGMAKTPIDNPFAGYDILAVSVNGTKGTSRYATGSTPTAACNGQSLNFPSESFGGAGNELDVSRQVYVPADDHFVRSLDIFTNPGTSAVSAAVTIESSNRTNGTTPGEVTGTSAGGTTATTSDAWVTTFAGFVSPATTSDIARIGNVLQNAYGTVHLSAVDFTDANAPTWTYPITVSPGQTVIIGNFGVPDASIDASIADSQRLATLPSTATECMTPAQVSELANFGTPPPPPAPVPGGYWLAGSTGGVYSYDAQFHGALTSSGISPVKPIVGMAATPDQGGYWLVGADGGVFTEGDAVFHGSAGNLHLNKPIVGMATTPDGGGYWLVASDGGIFTYGNALFHGSLGGQTINKPVVGMAATHDGGGYWLVAADGGVFTEGDAVFHGSAANDHLNAPIVGIAATPDGGGYWLVAADGGVFAYGDAVFYGSLGGTHLNKPIVAIAATPSGNGYRLIAADGGVFDFGDATFEGSAAQTPLPGPITAVADG
jgi:hypothetical protein